MPRSNGGAIFGAVLVATALVGAATFGVANITHEQQQTCTVSGKDPRIGGFGQDPQKPRLYTEDCGTFVIADVPFVSLRSGDIYGQLTEGETYELTTRGYRMPLLLHFPAVIEAVPLADTTVSAS